VLKGREVMKVGGDLRNAIYFYIDTHIFRMGKVFI